MTPWQSMYRGRLALFVSVVPTMTSIPTLPPT